MLLKIYQKYILNNFISTLGKVVFIFFGLIFILNLFEEISYFKDQETDFYTPLSLTLLNTPIVLYEVFPFIFLISTQFFYIKIIDNNELLAYKNFGINNFKILSFISLSSFVIGLLLVSLFYNFSAKLKFFYLDLKNNYSSDNKYLAVITENGIWIKDDINGNINIINAAHLEENYLKEVSITQLSKNFNLIKNIEAENADITNNEWILNKAVVYQNNFPKTEFESLPFETHFNFEKINSLFSNLSSLTIWSLIELREDYKSLKYSTKELDIHLNKLFSYPLYVALMSIISSILMLNIKYNTNKIFNLTLGILLSVIIYYINHFFGTIGLTKQLPIFFSNWLPLILLIVVSSIGLVRINEK